MQRRESWISHQAVEKLGLGMTVHLMPADLAAAWDRTNIASQDMKSRNHYKKNT